MLVILFVLTTAAGATFSAVTWRSNNKLNASLGDKENQIADLGKQIDDLGVQVDALQAEQTPIEDTNTIQALFDGVEVGQLVKTESGTLIVNSYEKTSYHDVVSSATSLDQDILFVRVTLSNTTNETPDLFQPTV